MKGTLKNQLRALKAEHAVMEFLEKNGPQRPSVIGLRCMPNDVKKGNHKQWANDVLFRLQQQDKVESERRDDGGVYYRIKTNA